MDAVTPGYKLTDAGVIPEGWEVTTVGEAGEVLGGRQRSPHAVGRMRKYLRVANVFDGYMDTDDVLSMPFTDKEAERFRLMDGDILLNEGQSLELVGRCAIYQGDPPDCCFQNTLVRFRAQPRTSSAFAQVVFNKYFTTGVFSNIALQTTSIAHLGPIRFARLAFPLPPLAEQNEIVKVLGDLDGLIAASGRGIAKRRDLKQAAMQQLLTGRTRLPGFADPWATRKLGDCLEPVQSGVSVRSVGGSDGERQAGPRILKTSAVSNGNFDESETKPIAPEDLCRARLCPKADTILMSRMNTVDLVGECGYVPRDIADVFIPDRLWRIEKRSDAQVEMNWLTAMLAHSHLKGRLKDAASGTSGSMKNIAQSALLNIQIDLPPLAEQRAIAAVLADFDAELEALEAERAKWRLVKQGAMQELLTGRTRLV